MPEEAQGIVNPKFMSDRGLAFSLSRMKIHSWSTLQAKLSRTSLDVYSLFGPYDLLCKHYSVQSLGIKDQLREQGIQDAFYSEVNEFRVERIDKIEGVEVKWEVYVDAVPQRTDWEDIFSLQNRWDSISADRRSRLIDLGMVLPKPAEKIDAFVVAFIFVKLLGVDTDEDLQLSRQYLESSVFRTWGSRIRGLFWGFSHSHYQCVIELWTEDLATLVEFVMRDLANSFPKGVETATHLVIEHLGKRGWYLSRLITRIPTVSLASEKEAMDLNTVFAEKAEGPLVEFKSSLRWDFREERVNKELVRAAVKEISAFMNTEGGLLLIGVDDKGTILGLEKDFVSLVEKPDSDGFRLTLAQGIENNLGTEYIGYTNVSFVEREGHQVCVVRVKKGAKPAFLKTNKGDKAKEFYIRTDNSSRPLDIEAAMGYIRMHWPLPT